MIRAVLGFLLLTALVPSYVHAYVSPGAPDGYVNDFADILSEDAELALEEELASYEASTTIEIAVVTVPSLDGDDVAAYANELGREWGIGQQESNNGVLVLVAPNDRKIRIEVGYGLEGAIPDITAGRIIDELMLPAFREDDYETGIASGVEAIEMLGNGESFPDVPSEDNDELLGTLFFGLIFGFNILLALVSILARSKSWWLGGVLGVLGGGILGFAFGSMYGGIAGAITLGFIGALFDFVVSRSYRSYAAGGSTPPWYFGGGSSGGGRSSSGGGFGGGSFGGGGASGSW